VSQTIDENNVVSVNTDGSTHSIYVFLAVQAMAAELASRCVVMLQIQKK
jgi:hypothetical protein